MGTLLTTILLAGLLTLFVLALLVALVTVLARLMKDAGPQDNATAGARGEQRFLRSSVLHVMNRAGR
ncbi:MAG TPA: hypothetical protein VKT25_04220 [Ktedonobacteraceae bacterium]|nr:hypothetical protein [Ktedonobacteraceae bacterium]